MFLGAFCSFFSVLSVSLSAPVHRCPPPLNFFKLTEPKSFLGGRSSALAAALGKKVGPASRLARVAVAVVIYFSSDWAGVLSMCTRHAAAKNDSWTGS